MKGAELVAVGVAYVGEIHRAERAIAELEKLLPHLVSVVRGGAVAEISTEDLVPGDVILLDEGNDVAADCRVIEAVGLRVSNATITGESAPVERDARVSEADSLGAATNVLLAGTSVVSGRGRAVVFATGAIPWEGIAIIPIAGIIVGNAMTGHTLVGRQAFAALRGERAQYEACLSLGMLPAQAIEESIHRRAPEALLPGLDQVKTTGVVTLPGAFIGVMLGGGSPVQAATAQALVLFGIMAAQTVTVAVAERLIAARLLLPGDLRAALID